MNDYFDDILNSLYERHCQGDDLCGQAQKAIERLLRLNGGLKNDMKAAGKVISAQEEEIDSFKKLARMRKQP